MTPRNRYFIALMALGWLVLIGFGLYHVMDRSLDSVFQLIVKPFQTAMQKLSGTEGRYLRIVRGQNRLDTVKTMYPELQSLDYLRNPPARLYGAYDGAFPFSFSGFVALENALDFTFPIISFYQAWGDRPEHVFPEYLMETISRLGSVPMVTWEPWVTEFDRSKHPQVGPAESREYGSLAAIASGTYDFHIKAWAAKASAFNRPFFLRFGHEMNDPYRYPWGPQQGNLPKDFIAAWRHTYEIFQAADAKNVLWVWSPHMASPWFEYYYPGDEYVDWVGATVLNYGEVTPWSRWWSFDQIVRNAYPKLQAFGKPVMLAEYATIGLDKRAQTWYLEAFHDMEEIYHDIRMVILFNQIRDVTLTPEPLNWSVLQSAEVTDIMREWLVESTRNHPTHPSP